MEYCSYAIDLLKRYGESSFQAQLAVILNDKYKDGHKDEDFTNSAEAAKAILEELSKTAKEKSERTNKTIVQLSAVSLVRASK